MSSTEINHEDWQETRQRVDSLSNAIFLIAGGALTLSISILLNLKDTGLLTTSVQLKTSYAWYFLLATIFMFLLLKGNLILQAFMRGTMSSEKFNSMLTITNTVSWVLGVVGFLLFTSGMLFLVQSAVLIINA